MKKISICLPASILIAFGINYFNHKNYYDTIFKVQTIDFNILANSLPTKLSLLLPKQNKKEVQNTINSNFGYFGIVVTNCTQENPECPNEEIIAKTQPEKMGWKEKITNSNLSEHYYDILRDPPPITAENKFNNSRSKISEWGKTGRINNGKIIGRVYYIRRDPPENVFQSQISWIVTPFNAGKIFLDSGDYKAAWNKLYQFFDNGANSFYILTYMGFISLGFLISYKWEQVDKKKKELESNNKVLQERIESLQAKEQRLTEENTRLSSYILQLKTAVSLLEENLESSKQELSNNKEELKNAIASSEKVQDELNRAISEYKSNKNADILDVISELEKQRKIAIERERELHQEIENSNKKINNINLQLSVRKASLETKENELEHSNLQIKSLKIQLQQEQQYSKSRLNQWIEEFSIENNKLIANNQRLISDNQRLTTENERLTTENEALISQNIFIESQCENLDLLNLASKIIQVNYGIDFSDSFVKDWNYWCVEDSQKAQRVFELIAAVISEPFNGIGNPKRLRHYGSNAWSRRVDQKHRLMYDIDEDRIAFNKCRGHYDDN